MLTQKKTKFLVFVENILKKLLKKIENIFVLKTDERLFKHFQCKSCQTNETVPT